MVAYINQQSYPLADEELLADVLYEDESQGSLFGGFFKKKPYDVFVYLRKVWYFDTQLELECDKKKIYLKM